MASLTSRQVFDEHARYVFRVVRYFGVREADVQDVCQEVFITVHRKIGEFEGRASIRTWLYRICQRAASDYRRRAHRRYEVPVDPAQPSTDGREHVETSSRLEARSELLAMLARLDADKRDVFVLYEVEGLTMREVAEVLECPLQTAYSRLHAARKILVDAVAEAPRGVEP